MKLQNYFLCLLCFLLATVVSAVAGAGFSSTIEGVNASDFPVIRSSLRVFTPEPIQLTSDAFKLSEDSTEISTFSVEMSGKSHYVALLLDRSSSMEPVIGKVRESASAFVRSISQKLQVSLITFASDIDVVTDFSAEPDPVLNGISKMRPWGGTALYDGLFYACEHLKKFSQRDDQKTIIILTDGKDESPQGTPGFSIKKPEDVFDVAVRNRIRVICAGLGSGIDVAFLKRLAQETRGAYLPIPSAEELQKLFQQISRRMLLERLYRITYTTPKSERDGTRRNLQIASELKGEKDQGSGFYIAPSMLPSDPLPEKGIQSGSMRIQHSLSLDRLQSPDLGDAAKVEHVDRVLLASYTDIATLTTDDPITREGMTEGNKAIEEANRQNRELYEKNQRDVDQRINETNKQLDEINTQMEEQLKENQNEVDEQIRDANQSIEEAEEAGKLDIEIPMPDSSDD
ncbi:MAG: VWA domain-containing protein [Candidatus Riflebacteria bacterium]|nr:VWA domain-containing protein [Candidatus Riflebacteria bacterium]